ncbi:imidazoleglycerol-phosphate dehydratase HisB [Clostridium cellulovorans]|uniref:Imidazoleglycerol-phosphate dehydratase n=1 Tax=Clostridium cellulovorans (strain ATCC 35296 / DSM 3052 / OCM 3 / 743B) TaxID=573061 RepID=D9SL17_CLOC7|nr:imidazoleglycerol-phosphate dehydratase HisB [Clostridium cellulovorans]ADL53589.1 Imidazoleglycerol-phosphate dehydratase [Clostridium cellulovorans 743B]
MKREATITRNTNETKINMTLNLDGSGEFKGTTGIGFFDHMLNLFTRHGLLDLEINCEGDLFVDCHHTVEDVGIVIGLCIKEALKDKAGIKRYGTSYLPMDETLALVSLDLSGRAFLVFDAEFTAPMVGELQTEMIEEFFRAVAFNAGITLHGKVLYGKNNHHMIESLFKGFGRALSEAVTVDPRIKGVMSTKGSI